MFSRFDTIPACDTPTYRQTDTQTHDDGYYPRIASTARVKMFKKTETTHLKLDLCSGKVAAFVESDN